MTTTQDASVGIAVESTYGTGVTPTRFLEFLDESLSFKKNIKQGAGLRVGSRVARSARRVVPTVEAGGDISMEVTSKGMGLLWAACLGAGVSTLVSTGVYQQLFTLGDVPPSLTVQKGLPRADGTVDAYTFLGCMVEKWELGFKQGDILQLKTSLDARDLTTGTAYAVPTYAASQNLYSFVGGAIASGALTAPTTTALASGGTVLANVRGGSVAVTNNIAQDRFNLGGAGKKSKPTVGLRAVTGGVEVEYTDTVFRDAVLNDTPMSLVLTWTAGALTTGFETLQIVVPEIKFDDEIAKANGTDLIIQQLKFTGLDNLTAAQPIWVVSRTSDAAL